MYCLQLFFNIGKTRDISAGLRDKKSTTTSKLHECNASFQVSTFLKSPMILCTLSGICFLCIPRFSTVISQPLFAFIGNILTCFISVSITIFYVGCKRQERQVVISFIRNKIKKRG